MVPSRPRCRARCSRHSRPSSAWVRGSASSARGVDASMRAACIRLPPASPVRPGTPRRRACSPPPATRPARRAAGPRRAAPGGGPRPGRPAPRAGRPGGGWRAGAGAWPPAGRRAGSGPRGWRAPCRRAAGAARRRRRRGRAGECREPLGLGAGEPEAGGEGSPVPGEQGGRPQHRVGRQGRRAGGHGAFGDGGGEHAGRGHQLHRRVRVGRLQDALELAPYALGRQPRDAAHAGGDGGDGVRIGRPGAVAGLEAEEAEDAQVVLGDPRACLPDEAHPAGGQVGRAAEIVVQRARRVQRHGVDGEVAPGCVLPPVIRPGDFGVPAIGQHVAAQGGDLVGPAVEQGGDGAVGEAGRDDAEAGGGQGGGDGVGGRGWRGPRRRPAGRPGRPARSRRPGGRRAAG